MNPNIPIAHGYTFNQPGTENWSQHCGPWPYSMILQNMVAPKPILQNGPINIPALANRNWNYSHFQQYLIANAVKAIRQESFRQDIQNLSPTSHQYFQGVIPPAHSTVPKQYGQTMNSASIMQQENQYQVPEAQQVDNSRKGNF